MAVALHVQLHAGRGDVGERTDRVDGVQERGFVTVQVGREAQLDLAAVAQAGGDQHPLDEQPRRAIEHRGRAAGAHIEPGGIDHQYRRADAAQERAPGQIDRLARTAALRQARLLHALQPLQRRQLPGLGEARQRARERGRRRHRTDQGGGALVKPTRERPQRAHAAVSSPPEASPRMYRA